MDKCEVRKARNHSSSFEDMDELLLTMEYDELALQVDVVGGSGRVTAVSSITMTPCRLRQDRVGDPQNNG